MLTSASKNDSDWKYAPTWGKNDTKYLLTYESANLYSLYIGDIRTFYGITSPTEKITSLAFVFRNADGSKTGKAAGAADIFVPVMAGGFQMALETSLNGNTFITAATATVKFSVGTTQNATIKLAINGNYVAEKANATLLEYTYTFTEEGNYSIIASAENAEGEKKQDMLKLVYAQSSPTQQYPGGVPKMGPVKNADGSVTFCLAAPQKESVILVGSWNDYDASNDNIMYRQDYNGQRYFWRTVSGLDNTTQYMYYFLVDGAKSVGDPYAKLVLDPSNDKYIPSSVYPNLPAYPNSKVRNVSLAVYQGNINDYNWTDKDFTPVAKENLVIYEMLFRDFTGTEGLSKGNGTVRQAIEKIPYLKSLGINAVELLPINEFNGNISWGYNPNFYFAPDKAYGTPDDYKDFINACHENGIAVILDMVFNQSDWQHPWYQLYPVGSNPFFNATAPHAFSVLNDWNQGHPLVRQQWQDVVKYWMTEYHVDGYRFDLVKGLGNNDSYANSGDAATGAYNSSRVANMRAIQLAMNTINPKAFFINENLAGAKEENEMADFGMLNWANINNSGCQFAMGYNSDSGLDRMYAPNDGRNLNSTVAYLESHDEERLAYKQVKYGASSVKNDHAVAMRRCGSAAAQMIMQPGAHMIWMFSEMGNAQTTKNADGSNNVDPKKVNWNLLQDPDNDGLMKCYSELIAIRTGNPEFFAPNASFTSVCKSSNWNNGRYLVSSLNGQEIITVVNPLTTRELSVSVPFSKTNNSDYTIASKSFGTTPVVDVAAGTVTLPVGGYAVLVTKGVTGVEAPVADAEGSLAVYGAQGELRISGATAGYRVYDVNGALVASGNDSETALALPAGLYITVSGNASAKTLLR